MSAFRMLRQLPRSSRIVARAASAPRLSSALPAFARTSARTFSAPPARAFSASARARGEGATDVALLEKLQEEVEYEQEAAKKDSEPEFLTKFKAQKTWSIDETTGHDEVAIVRRFGNEKIRLMFSIADVQAAQQQQDEMREENTEGEEIGEDDEMNQSFPVRCSIAISKGKEHGALVIDALCQEGTFMLDNLCYYKDATIATALTPEAEFQRRALYLGPQFDTLDVGVQEEFEKYLQERGIDDNLALFIPEYSEFKEQKEYVSWLNGVKNFVKA